MTVHDCTEAKIVERCPSFEINGEIQRQNLLLHGMVSEDLHFGIAKQARCVYNVLGGEGIASVLLHNMVTARILRSRGWHSRWLEAVPVHRCRHWLSLDFA